MSLLEVVLASVLLATAAVPIINAVTRVTQMTREIELRTTCTLLAQKELEIALAAADADFASNLGQDSKDLGAGYRATIQESVAGLTKTIAVQVGWDASGNGVLEADEVLTTLATMVADRGT
jgi:Tfp pilus assembly protein PilV